MYKNRRRWKESEGRREEGPRQSHGLEGKGLISAPVQHVHKFDSFCIMYEGLCKQKKKKNRGRDDDIRIAERISHPFNALSEGTDIFSRDMAPD